MMMEPAAVFVIPVFFKLVYRYLACKLHCSAKSIDALIAEISGVTGALQNAVAVSNLRRAVQGPCRRVGRVGWL